MTQQKGNPHFRKYHERRRFKKLLKLKDAKNYLFQYNEFTGRLKRNARVRRKLNTHRLIKKLRRRNSRRFSGEIPNGAFYKKLPCNSTY